MTENKPKYKKTKYNYKEISDIVDFGSHRGETVQSVIDKDKAYFEWCSGNFGSKFKLSKKILKYFEEKWNRPFKTMQKSKPYNSNKTSFSSE